MMRLKTAMGRQSRRISPVRYMSAFPRLPPNGCATKTDAKGQNPTFAVHFQAEKLGWIRSCPAALAGEE
jgi:hypothetical protein